MRRLVWLSAALCAVVGLTGCGTTQRTEAARFQVDRSTCETDVDRIATTPIQFVEKRSEGFPRAISFEKAARCILAKDGEPVPLVLMAVDQAVPLEVEIRLLMRREITFAAAVDLLDAQRQLRRTVPFANFVRRGNAYSATVFLNAEDADVRYLALRPDSDAVGDSSGSITGRRHTSTFAVIAGGALYASSFTTGSEVLVTTWLSEVGEFSVRGLKPEGAVQGN